MSFSILALCVPFRIWCRLWCHFVLGYPTHPRLCPPRSGKLSQSTSQTADVFCFSTSSAPHPFASCEAAVFFFFFLSVSFKSLTHHFFLILANGQHAADYFRFPPVAQSHIDNIVATTTTPISPSNNTTSSLAAGPLSGGGGGARQKRTKIYCDKWIHDGTCAFTQQGCKYKHEMPHDKATQHMLGLFMGYPVWWKKRQAELSRRRDDVASPVHSVDAAAITTSSPLPPRRLAREDANGLLTFSSTTTTPPLPPAGNSPGVGVFTAVAGLITPGDGPSRRSGIGSSIGSGSIAPRQRAMTSESWRSGSVPSAPICKFFSLSSSSFSSAVSVPSSH